ncbi:hypothetical protein [Rhizobium sp. BK379]|jgi:hypothetical protein|uniref:hypothetical protein n=1 Tax=Rhizobium sp. BK379 TaxID=2587059 RepID=UPI000DD67D2A|nr:hypothetical protein [Rhizobium sp. BK379]MBB3443593.1 hypothetical protein [Rhizobium sp. BK379]
MKHRNDNDETLQDFHQRVEQDTGEMAIHPAKPVTRRAYQMPLSNGAGVRSWPCSVSYRQE